MAWVVDVLDDLFGLPMASGAVGVQESGKFTPGDALGRPHQPLESFAIVGGAFAVPTGCSQLCICKSLCGF